jgi:hypothetical protein
MVTQMSDGCVASVSSVIATNLFTSDDGANTRGLDTGLAGVGPMEISMAARTVSTRSLSSPSRNDPDFRERPVTR